MVERAGMDMDPVDALAPGEAQRLGQKPAPVPLPGELGNQADEVELAFAAGAKIELEDAHLARVLTDDREKFDLGMVNDRREGGIVHVQPREPEPARAHQPEQPPVFLKVRPFDLPQR